MCAAGLAESLQAFRAMLREGIGCSIPIDRKGEECSHAVGKGVCVCLRHQGDGRGPSLWKFKPALFYL